MTLPRTRNRYAPAAGQAALFDFGTEPDPEPGPLPEPDPPAAPEPPRPAPEPAAPLTPAERAAANIAAITALRALRDEDRPATAAELDELEGFTGWGAIPEVFDRAAAGWALKTRARLSWLLTTPQIAAAARSTLNGHYTDPAVAAVMWDAAAALGFTGGRVLEPGCGAGTVIRQAPAAAEITGIELDPVTADIAAAATSAAIRCESFAATHLPEGSFDLAVGNVPFGDFAMPEPDPVCPADGDHNIHNHCIIKTLRLLRPGGIAVLLTSRYTLDSEKDKARRVIAGLADLIGAVRLPAGSHQAAAGTRVVMDLLIFRRRHGTRAGGLPFLHAPQQDIDGARFPLSQVYGHDGGGHVLGAHAAGSSAHGPDLTVTPDTTRPLAAQLADAVAQITAQAVAAGLGWTPDGEAPPELPGDEADGEMEGHVTACLNGSFTQVTRGRGLPIDVPATHRAELAALCHLRDTLRGLLAEQAAHADDTGRMLELRAQLNTAYDDCFARYGPLNRFTRRKTGWYKGTCRPAGNEVKVRKDGLIAPGVLIARCEECGQHVEVEPGMAQVSPVSHRFFRHDPHAPLVYALEDFEPVSQAAIKERVFDERVIGARTPPGTADTPADAIAISMDARGHIDMDYVAGLLGTDPADARADMGELAYEDPEQGGRLVPAAEYLSGRVRDKLLAAHVAAADNPLYEINVAALAKVIAEKLPELGPKDIAVSLGAAWIPADDVQDWLRELLDDDEAAVSYGGGGVWAAKSPRGRAVLATATWGTERRPAYDLAESLLNQSPITVYDVVKDGDRERRIFNPQETTAAQEKAAALQEEFRAWVWRDPERAHRLVDSYNTQFNGIVLRSYDGVRLTLPGLAAWFDPHPHQHAAVARAVQEPSALLAHSVGAGKTASCVMAVMELRRLALVHKAVVVVPNHLLGQFLREWLQLYPLARVLAAGSEDLSGDGARRFAARIATGNWDAVIMTQSAFRRIPLPAADQEAYLQAEIDEVTQWIAASDGYTVKRLEGIKIKLEKRLKKAMGDAKAAALTFDLLGVDYLAVDEFHGYKNLRTMSNIPDANIEGSQRASDMHMKVEWLRARKPGGRIILAMTATPIANSITEAHVVQRYLRPEDLRAADVIVFDRWGATFGQVVSRIELAPEGGRAFRMGTRFARFHNIPELLRMFHTFADVKLADDLNLDIPLIAERRGDGQRVAEIITTEPDPRLEAYVAELGERASAIRDGEPWGFPTGEFDEHNNEIIKWDNMLLVSTHGRMAALDLRMVDQPQATPGKLATAARNIARIVREHPGKLNFVFCDLGTPKATGWNAYDELSMLLTAEGVPPQQIAYIHSAKTDRDKTRLIAACNAGKIAVLLGSTEKMGTGFNAQKVAVAVHHLDATWRPADIEQREGRAVRQRNTCPEVHVYRYVTLRSFDAYMWQTLERKAQFIAQFMRGRLDVREIDDVGDLALSFDEIKAITTDNPHVLEAARLSAEVTRLERAERAWSDAQAGLEWTLRRHAAGIDRAQGIILGLDAALARREDVAGEHFTMTVDGLPYAKRADAGARLRDWLATQAGEILADMKATRQDLAITRIHAGRLAGFDVLASFHGTAATRKVAAGVHVGLELDGVYDSDLTVTPGELRPPADDDEKPADPAGLIRRLEHRAARIEQLIGAQQQAIAEAERETGHARAEAGKPFPHTAELADARDQAAAVAEKMGEIARQNDLARAGAAHAAAEKAAA